MCLVLILVPANMVIKQLNVLAR